MNFIEAVKKRWDGNRVKCGVMELFIIENGVVVKFDRGGQRSFIAGDALLDWEVVEETKKSLSDKIKKRYNTSDTTSYEYCCDLNDIKKHLNNLTSLIKLRKFKDVDDKLQFVNKKTKEEFGERLV